MTDERETHRFVPDREGRCSAEVDYMVRCRGPAHDPCHAPNVWPEETERVEAAAIKEGGVVYTAPHHHQIIRYLAAMGKPTPISGEQGFITSRNRFVNRATAAGIAWGAGQIQDTHDLLMSEHLWNVTDYAFAGLAPPAPTPERAPARMRQIIEAIPGAMEELRNLPAPDPVAAPAKCYHPCVNGCASRGEICNCVCCECDDPAAPPAQPKPTEEGKG